MKENADCGFCGGLVSFTFFIGMPDRTYDRIYIDKILSSQLGLKLPLVFPQVVTQNGIIDA